MSIGQTRLNFKQTTYTILLGAVGIILLSASLLVPTTQALTLDLNARDNDANAVIRNGAASTEELLQKYNNQPDVRALFEHFGITSETMSRIGSTAVAGIVNENNQILVDGKVVATGAMTAGRQNMSGSTAISAGGTTFYKRPPSVSFQTKRLKAFVVMTKNDRFVFAILGSCGNPVTATPKPPETPKTPPAAKPTQPKPEVAPPTPQPAPPAPAPAPQQQQQQSQEQQQAAFAAAEANVTVNQEKVEQPTPQVIRVEVPPTTAPQAVAAAAPAPTPTQELPKTGMDNVSTTLGVAGVATLIGTVAHFLLTRRKLSV